MSRRRDCAEVAFQQRYLISEVENFAARPLQFALPRDFALFIANPLAQLTK
jgi:hypothetical protein